MRTFNDNIPCQSSLTIGDTNYKLKKLSLIEGNGFVFTEEQSGREPDSFHITSQTLKALYLLITTNEEKK